MRRRHIDRLDSDAIAAVEERMRCGPHRPICFLGEQERLQNVIAEDERTLSRFRAGYEEIAQLLGDIVAHPERHPEVHVENLEQPLECPFEPGIVYLHSNQSFIVRMNQQELSFPGILLHLIAAHQFFGGAGSPYRLDPEQAIRLLRLHERGQAHEAADRTPAKNSI